MGTFERLVAMNTASLLYALVLVCALRIAMARRGASRKRRLLMEAMDFHIAATCARLAAWSLVRRPGPAVHLALEASMTCADALSILTCLAVMVYVYTDVSGRSVEEQGVSRIVMVLWVLNGLNMLLVLTNPWTKVYHFFDAANTYRVGSAYWLRNLLFFVQGVVMIPVVVRLRASNGTPMTVRYIACGSLAVFSTIGEMLLPGVTLLFPAVSLMLALFAVGVQARLEEDLAQARADAAESRLRLLSGQISRHFAFNSLAAIKELVVQDPAAAEAAIQDFSDYLRSHLDVMADVRLVPFSDELDHIRHYVALELADCATPFEVRYDLGTVDFEVPPLTVQPLVENAIRHGIRTREDAGLVEVTTRLVDGHVEVRVHDDGHGLSSATALQDRRQRVGIENVRERIERQCGGSLKVWSSAEGTTALLTIPGGGDHEEPRGR